MLCLPDAAAVGVSAVVYDDVVVVVVVLRHKLGLGRMLGCKSERSLAGSTRSVVCEVRGWQLPPEHSRQRS